MKPYIVQDYYPDKVAVCYGCGRHHPGGLHIRTLWNGAEGVCRFTPRTVDSAFPGVVYGGLLANLIDCHAVGTAVAAMYQFEGRPPGSDPVILCVTANLNVDYIKPTPLGPELTLRARVETVNSRKAEVVCPVFTPDETLCVHGRVVAVRIPLEKF